MIDWVQDGRMWFERKYEKPARGVLLRLVERARQSAQEPLKRMAGTLTRWFEPIAHYIRHRYSNGMTEGFNNKIKLIQRRARSTFPANMGNERRAGCEDTTELTTEPES